jgi:hypothetical protein
VVEQTPPFLAAKNLKDFISDELVRSMKPIRFKPLSRGGFRGMAFGFKGNIFPLVCRVYVDAMYGGKLRAPQLPIAERCKVVLNALQSVAIDALIDEATGYQDVRPKDDLRRLLDRLQRPH